MTFARLMAALIVLGASLTPLARGVRALSLAHPVAPESLGAAGPVLGHLVGLLLLYAASVLLVALVRRLLVATGDWHRSGLAALDEGMHAGWPRPAALVLGLAAVGAALRAGGNEVYFAAAEAAAATVAVVLAVGGAPPLRVVDESEPLPDPLPAPPPPEPGAAGDLLEFAYDWYFRPDPSDVTRPASAYRLAIRASKQRYEAFQQADHAVQAAPDYTRFVRDGLSAEVGAAAAQIRQLSQRDGLDTVGEINNVLAFAQRFAYALDRDDKGVVEYPKYPLETLVEDRGDCEDHAILAAACLATLGYTVCLVSLAYGAGPGHMALAVACPQELPGGFFLEEPTSGRKFYYCEVSTDAAARDPNALSMRMGEIPEPDRAAQLALLPIAIAPLPS